MTPENATISDAVPAEAPEKTLAEMTEAELAQWDSEFLASLEAGDDSAARASLAAGVPIYYRENDTPIPGIIKEYPDGSKELVSFADGTERFLQSL
jgi:hypothetical protein